MKLNLPDTVSSPQDLDDLITEVRDYSRWFSHNAIKERTHAQRGVAPPELSAAAHELIRYSSGKKLLSLPILDELHEALEKLKSTALVLTITLAAPPTISLKTALVSWCRQNIASGVLVSFGFNSTLLGGMVVRFGSHIFDWSFRRQILKTKQQFPEVLRRV